MLEPCYLIMYKKLTLVWLVYISQVMCIINQINLDLISVK